MQFHYEYRGDSYHIQLEPGPDGRCEVTINGRRLAVEAYRLSDGGWRLVIDGESVVGYSAADGTLRHVGVHGETFVLAVPERQARRRAAASSGDLSAQMPGQVIDVRVAEGDTVQAGQTLVVLEAMKMEFRVTAPVSGEIRRLLVAAGDVVERGQRLVEIEEDVP
jgi:3-methylcrotonyl-CoA carboxylase alpha subunit